MLKRIVSSLVVLVTLVFWFAFSPQITTARTISSEGAVTISENEEYYEDLYLGGEVVTISGVVNGDVYAAGRTILVDGTINGDLLVAGGNIEVSGSIRDDLRASGGFVALRTLDVGDNATIIAGRVNISSDTTVGGSMQLAGGEIINDAVVKREMYIGAGSIVLNGSVDQDVFLGAQSISFGPSTQFNQNFTYATDGTLNQDDSAQILGETKKVSVAKASNYGFSGDIGMIDGVSRGAHIGFSIWSYTSALLIGLLMLYFFRPQAKGVVTTIVTRPWGSLGWGLLVSFLTPFVFGLLLMSVIGIPLALILLFAFFVALYVAKIFAGLVIGTYISQFMDKSQPNAYVTFGIGLLAYYLLTLIPIIHFIVTTISILISLGALFINSRRKLFYERE